MTGEEFRPIPGYEGLYEVSADGLVRSIARLKPGPRGRSLMVPEHLVAQHLNREGYVRLRLHKHGKAKNWFVHRLVALVWLPAPADSNQASINHRDGNKSHNSATNLEWCTTKENIRHAHATGLTKMQGEDHRNSKLSEAAVREIRRLIAGGARKTEIAVQFGVTPTNIGHIAHGRAWRHVS